MTVEAHGFVQAWLDINLPEQGADPARLARRCRAAAKEIGVCIEDLEPEWGAPLKDIILGVLERRQQAGRLTDMPNEEGRPDYLDPSRVREDDEYDVACFASLNGITPDQVRELIKKHGNSRAKLEEAAKVLRQQQ